MSKSKENVITKTYSGKFGNQVVFRNRDGQSILAKPPKKPTGDPTKTQLETRNNFLNASQWAKSILTDPVLGPVYKAKASKGKSAYVLAVTDFLRRPVIDAIDASEYQGKIGDKIMVNASDNFNVAEVGLKITNPQGEVVEEGACQKDQHHSYWVYTATVTVASITGLTLTARVKDNPGHSGEAMLTLE